MGLVRWIKCRLCSGGLVMTRIGDLVRVRQCKQCGGTGGEPVYDSDRPLPGSQAVRPAAPILAGCHDHEIE